MGTHSRDPKIKFLNQSGGEGGMFPQKSWMNLLSSSKEEGDPLQMVAAMQKTLNFDLDVLLPFLNGVHSDHDGPGDISVLSGFQQALQRTTLQDFRMRRITNKCC